MPKQQPCVLPYQQTEQGAKQNYWQRAAVRKEQISLSNPVLFPLKLALLVTGGWRGKLSHSFLRA